MINKNEKTVLWAAIEDYCGLWELPWEIRSIHPSMTVAESQPKALEALLSLLGKGYVELLYCEEPYGSLTALDSEDYLHILQKPYYWEVPMPGTQAIRVSATKEGEALLMENP